MWLSLFPDPFLQSLLGTALRILGIILVFWGFLRGQKSRKLVDMLTHIP